MLTFENYGVEFASPNFSNEIHGDELKPLMSIVFEAVVNAANLESFKAGITDALWKRPAVNDSERLDDSGVAHQLVKRFGTAKPLAFEDKFPGYSLVVHKSELFDDTCKWPDVEVGKVSVEAENGGTARVKVRLQIRGDNDELSWWVSMMGRAAEITLTPPADKPLPANHPDAPKDDDPLSGSLEFGRDAKRDDDDPDDSDSAGAPEGFDAARMKEAEEDAAASSSRKATSKRGKKSNGATAEVH